MTKKTFNELLRAHFSSTPGGNLWISSELKLALSAAEKYWGDPRVVLADKNTHPSSKRMKTWLAEQGAGTKAIERILKVIRPESAAPPGRPED